MNTYLVSACLLGINCKYSGGNNRCPKVLALMEHARLIPVCPEQLGGLPTPRPAAECQGTSVQNREGRDVTQEFQKGAVAALELARLFHCDGAILKARSPSCGAGEIYDGTFTGTVVSGDGITARLLRKTGLPLYTEDSLPEA